MHVPQRRAACPCRQGLVDVDAIVDQGLADIGPGLGLGSQEAGRCGDDKCVACARAPEILREKKGEGEGETPSAVKQI